MGTGRLEMARHRIALRLSLAVSAAAVLAGCAAVTVLSDDWMAAVCAPSVLVFFAGLAFPIWYRYVGRQHANAIAGLVKGGHWAR